MGTRDGLRRLVGGSPIRRSRVAGALGVVLLGFIVATYGATPQSANAAGSDMWTGYLNYPSGHLGYNANFTAFGPSNAASLVKKWSFATGGAIESNPAVALVTGAGASACAGTGVPLAFVGSWDGSLYAFNATTGALCWKTFLATDTLSPPSTQCLNSLGVTSSPTVANVAISGTSGQIVYAGAADVLFALDATNGKVAWQTAVAGVPAGTFSAAYIWSSPAYSPGNNTVYTSTASFCDAKAGTDGTIYALDPASGKINAHLALTPNNAPGPGVWGSPTVSASQSRVYVTTGNAFTSSNAQLCLSSQSDSCAVLALDWNTLAIKSSWQIPTSQFAPDGDFGTTPTLFAGPSGATWLGAGNKNGWFYALDTGNLAGGPKWSVKLSKGGENSINGIIGPAAYYPNTIGGCTGVLFVGAGATTLSGTAFGGSMSALCATTGMVLWQQGTAGHIIAAPVVANGLVADEQGGVVEVRNWSTGAVLFHFKTGGAAHGAAAFANGKVYVGSADKNLYAFG